MSDCRLPREIKITPNEITIKITGNYYSSSYGYVIVGGTTYTSNQTLTITPPQQITVYCSASGSTYRQLCEILFDNVTVAQGTSSSAASYTFTADKSYTITITRAGTMSSRRYWTATIVSGVAQ